MPYTYLLQCCDDSFYVGSTWDLARRLEEHQTGLGSRHTANRLPVELVYAEEYERIDDAYHRERQIHGWSRSKKTALLQTRYDQLPTLARKIFRWPPFDTPPTAALRERPYDDNDCTDILGQ